MTDASDDFFVFITLCRWVVVYQKKHSWIDVNTGEKTDPVKLILDFCGHVICAGNSLLKF